MVGRDCPHGAVSSLFEEWKFGGALRTARHTNVH